MSSKIKDKEGLYFRAPVGGLQKNPYSANGGNNRNDSTSEDGLITKKQLDEETKGDGGKKTKKKKIKKRPPPTVKEIREHIDKMITMHAKMVEEETPVLYPILLETKRKRKKKNESNHSSLIPNANLSGLPICYGSDGKSSFKYRLAGESGKVLR